MNSFRELSGRFWTACSECQHGGAGDGKCPRGGYCRHFDGCGCYDGSLLPVDRLRWYAGTSPRMRRHSRRGDYAVLWGQVCHLKHGCWKQVGCVDDTKNNKV